MVSSTRFIDPDGKHTVAMQQGLGTHFRVHCRLLAVATEVEKTEKQHSRWSWILKSTRRGQKNCGDGRDGYGRMSDHDFLLEEAAENSGQRSLAVR